MTKTTNGDLTIGEAGRRLAELPDYCAWLATRLGMGVVRKYLIDEVLSRVDEYGDGKFIAAEPDLLALARRVADHFRDTDAPLGIEARAAIARAEGR